MPFTATYTQYYGLGSTAPTATFTVSSTAANVVSNTISDTDDGADDGDLAPNADVDWTASPGMQYFGQTDAGDPILLDTSINQYYLLSNTSGLQGSMPGFQTTTYTMCFAAGTGIATPNGDVAVETLQIGDLVMTADGREVPVLWIGHQNVSTLIAGHRAEPVCISKGALGNGLPKRDLTLTADHAMVVEGMLVNASTLVNGDSITFTPRESLPEHVTYYHVETEAHEVILAEGAATESFADAAGRKSYANYRDYLAHYGAERLIKELPMPRISTSRLLPESLRAQLGIGNDPGLKAG